MGGRAKKLTGSFEPQSSSKVTIGETSKNGTNVYQYTILLLKMLSYIN